VQIHVKKKTYFRLSHDTVWIEIKVRTKNRVSYMFLLTFILQRLLTIKRCFYHEVSWWTSNNRTQIYRMLAMMK